MYQFFCVSGYTRGSMPHTLQLLSPEEYVADATKLIKNAKTRVSFLSMVVTHDHTTNKLIDALAVAAKRGVKVNVAADMFTYTELSGQFIPSHYYSKRVRETTRMTRTLTQSGVHFHWLGRLNISTISGRTHSKWCVIDDTVFSFGGVNLYETGIGSVDYMFKITDKALADRLIKEQTRIVQADKQRYSYHSSSFSIDEHSTALMDGGFFGESLIYKRACELAELAKEVILVSQYCPTGKLSKILKRTPSKLYFNSWQTASSFNRMIIRAGILLSGHQTLYAKETYLHGKFIIFTMPDDTKIAITGSHNFIHGGVLLGTKEIALETTDPKVIRQLERFFKDSVQ